MHKPSFVRNKKGINNVIAIVLVVIAVVATFAVAYLVFPRPKIYLSIETLEFNNTTLSKVHVRNVGDQIEIINAVYINGIEAVIRRGSVSVAPGAVAAVELTSAILPTSGTVITIQAACQDGTSASLQLLFTADLSGATKGGTIPTGQISIDSIALQNTGKYWIYVRNIGVSGSVIIDTAYINNVQAAITGGSVVINAGDVQKIELTMVSGIPASGDTIKVYASGGSIAQGTAP